MTLGVRCVRVWVGRFRKGLGKVENPTIVIPEWDATQGSSDDELRDLREYLVGERHEPRTISAVKVG